MAGTRGSDYTNRLAQLEGRAWKQLLNVQAPYQWYLRRQQLGRTLEIGCGIGRNLGTLGPDSIGLDHNASSVETARSRGFTAFTTDEWRTRPENTAEAFDGLLIAHVVEHMTRAEAVALLRTYLPSVRPGGRVFLVCPQERGYASDNTHVAFTTGEDLASIAAETGLEPGRPRSFPLPRVAGRWFRYNEFTLLARKPSRA